MQLIYKVLLIISLLIVLGYVAQFVIFDQFSFKHSSDLLLSINRNSAVNANNQLSIYFKEAKTSLEEIANDHDIRNDGRILNKVTRTNQIFDDILILNKQGKILNSSVTMDLPSIDLSQKDYFQDAIQGKTYVSGVFTNMWNKQVIAISVPIINNNIIDGVVVGFIQLHSDNLASMFETRALSANGFIAISDNNGIIVYHSNKERIGKEGALVNSLRGLSGAVVMKSYSAGEDTFIGYERNPEVNWLVMVGTPTSELLRYRNVMFNENLIVDIFIILIVSIISMYAVRKYTIQFDKLINAFNLLKNKKYDKINIGDDKNEFSEMFKVYNDTVSKLEEFYIVLNGAAEIDGLTGIYNRRVFDKTLTVINDEIHNRTIENLAIMILDLDFFKQLNDTHGHLAGDDILKTFASIMQSIVGEKSVFRFGGDEFVIILRNIPFEKVLLLAEDIRVQCERELKGCTVSIGIASYPQNANTLETLLDVADKSLYMSKKIKNKITVSS